MSREPLDPGRFVPMGGSPFMGCGEYNPLSVSVQDAESRRAVVFVLDPAAGPAGVPCQLRSIGPCQSNCGPPPDEPNADGSPPYRCKVYQTAAKKCPCQGGADLSHDLVVRIPYPLEDADDLPHAFTLATDDDTISQTRKLSSDCRAADAPQMAEILFSHLPETHAYTLECDDGDETYSIFERVPYRRIPEVLAGAGAAQASGLGPLDDHTDDDGTPSDGDAPADGGGGDGSTSDADADAPAGDGSGDADASVTPATAGEEGAPPPDDQWADPAPDADGAAAADVSGATDGGGADDNGDSASDGSTSDGNDA